MARVEHQFVARRISFKDEYGDAGSHVWTCRRCGGSPHFFEARSPQTPREMEPIDSDCDVQLAASIISS